MEVWRGPGTLRGSHARRFGSAQGPLGALCFVSTHFTTIILIAIQIIIVINSTITVLIYGEVRSKGEAFSLQRKLNSFIYI